jgi:hypothetical protein
LATANGIAGSNIVEQYVKRPRVAIFHYT